VRSQEGLEAILLGLTTAIAGILVGGIFDHYFFNLSFPHSVSIFWIFLGLAMVTIRLGTQAGTEDVVQGKRIGATAEFAV
jgi:ABC-type antimicrobial peptide transport system permease subunit